MARADRGPRLGALVLIIGVGPLATDMYLPALPNLAAQLGTTAGLAQSSLTGFFIGVAVGQLVFGPLSDRLGRRLFVVGGPIVFAVSSALCAIAPSIIFLDLLRVGQGLAAAAGIVAGRAVVSDYFDRETAARHFGLVGSLTSLGPVLAPVVGASILVLGSWRLVFVVLCFAGAAMSISSYRWIPETLSIDRTLPVPPIRATVLRLVHRGPFRGVVVTGSLVTGAMFVYVAASPFIFQAQYSLSHQQFTVLFATNSAGIIGGGLIFRHLVAHVRVTHLLSFGLAISGCAAAVLVIAILCGISPLAVVWTLLGVTMVGMGFTNPAIVVLAQRAGAPSSGTAAALQGGVQFLVGAVAAPMTGTFGHPSVTAMACLMCACLAGAVLVHAVSQRVDTRAWVAIDRQSGAEKHI